MTHTETELYEKIQKKTDSEIFLSFVYESFENVLPIKNITFYAPNDDYSKYEAIRSYLGNTAKQSKYDKIYIINPRYAFTEIIKENSKMETINNVNFLKYMKMYPEEIIINDDNSDNEDNNNEYLKNKLISEYKTALFFSTDDLFISGIDGYFPYDKSYDKYLNTIDKIYFVNKKNKQGYHGYYHAWNKPELPEHTNVETIDNIDVFKFLKTYPELNAFHRAHVDNMTFYIDRHYDFKRIVKVTDNIHLGGENYEYYDNYDKYFEKHKITDIIDVSDSYYKSKKGDLLKNITQYNIPISESSPSSLSKECAQNFSQAVEKLNDLVKQNKQIYVHCAAGINRSPAVICMWLMKYGGFTFYTAYKKLAELRFIWTMQSLYDILYEFAKETNKNDISPLKIVNHKATNINTDTRMMFAIYDTIHLDLLYNQ